jgi:hypothetical protein
LLAIDRAIYITPLLSGDTNTTGQAALRNAECQFVPSVKFLISPNFL